MLCLQKEDGHKGKKQAVMISQQSEEGFLLNMCLKVNVEQNWRILDLNCKSELSNKPQCNPIALRLEKQLWRACKRQLCLTTEVVLLLWDFEL